LLEELAKRWSASCEEKEENYLETRREMVALCMVAQSFLSMTGKRQEEGTGEEEREDRGRKREDVEESGRMAKQVFFVA